MPFHKLMKAVKIKSGTPHNLMPKNHKSSRVSAALGGSTSGLSGHGKKLALGSDNPSSESDSDMLAMQIQKYKDAQDTNDTPAADPTALGSDKSSYVEQLANKLGVEMADGVPKLSPDQQASMQDALQNKTSDNQSTKDKMWADLAGWIK